jgi:hypothetical protein
MREYRAALVFVTSATYVLREEGDTSAPLGGTHRFTLGPARSTI